MRWQAGFLNQVGQRRPPHRIILSGVQAQPGLVAAVALVGCLRAADAHDRNDISA